MPEMDKEPKSSCRNFNAMLNAKCFLRYIFFRFTNRHVRNFLFDLVLTFLKSKQHNNHQLTNLASRFTQKLPKTNLTKPFKSLSKISEPY